MSSKASPVKGPLASPHPDLVQAARAIPQAQWALVPAYRALPSAQRALCPAQRAKASSADAAVISKGSVNEKGKLYTAAAAVGGSLQQTVLSLANGRLLSALKM